MQEYKFNNATVRVHGSYDVETIRSATEKYLKKVVASRKKQKGSK